jgi:gas vesicle protein
MHQARSLAGAPKGVAEGVLGKGLALLAADKSKLANRSGIKSSLQNWQNRNSVFLNFI